MRAPFLIGLIVIVLWHCGFAQGRGAKPAAAQYRIDVRNGIITLTQMNSGEVLGRTTFEMWGVVSPTRDKLRHVALDITAALVAGNGAREHPVDPNSPVCTSAEDAKPPCVTATVEHGVAFIILKDQQTNGLYEAFLISSASRGHK
jgi:hypothetical protein